MERYISREDHPKAVQGIEVPWIREYAEPGTLDFHPLTALDGDRYCIDNDRNKKEYFDYGYVWALGMCLGKKWVSRTFVAPHDGLLSVAPGGDLDMFSFYANQSSLRFMKNEEILWPQVGEYPDDFFPITYEHRACMPTFLVNVKAGDRLRFIGRNTCLEDRYDDVVWTLELTYLPFSFTETEYCIAPGEEKQLGMYNETGASPHLVVSDPTVAEVDDSGRVIAKKCGSAAIRAYVGEELLASVQLWVCEKGRDPRNPFGLADYHAEPFSTPGGALSLSTTDTLQLGAELGVITCSHGIAPTSAVRFDQAGEKVTLPHEGMNEEALDFCLTTAYRGERTLKTLSIITATNHTQGKLLHLEFWYSKTSAPEDFIFFYAYDTPGQLTSGTHFSLALADFGGCVCDVHTLRVLVRRTAGMQAVIEEIDADFENDGEEIAALRREKQEKIWQPTVFSDGMMIQRDMPVRVWGYGGREGDLVSVSIRHADGASEVKEARIEGGKWLAELAPHPADDRGSEITVSYREQTFVYHDVWFGELYWAGGQSNMEVGVSLLPAAEQETYLAAIEKNPRIRWYAQSQCAAEKPRLDTFRGSWHTPDIKNYKAHSAVALAYILHMEKVLDIPVGIVYGAVGATRLEAWLPESFYDENTPYGKRILSRFRPRVTEGELWYRPCGPFHQMVHPLTDLNIRGIIWYQGEANSRDTRDYPFYEERLYEMLNYWRMRFRNPDLFIGTVQLAPLVVGYDGAYGWCCIREDLLNLYLDHPHEAPTAVITDTADETHDCHPPNKNIVGRRLGEAVAGAIYGIGDVYMGPIPNAMTVEGEAARLTFDFVGSGLVANDGGALRGFEISEDGKNFVPATAVIEGDTLRVSADGVKTPFEVRFAFTSCPNVNFFNKEGFPATPFRIRESGLVRERDLLTEMPE